MKTRKYPQRWDAVDGGGVEDNVAFGDFGGDGDGGGLDGQIKMNEERQDGDVGFPVDRL